MTIKAGFFIFVKQLRVIKADDSNSFWRNGCRKINRTSLPWLKLWGLCHNCQVTSLYSFLKHIFKKE